MTASNEGEGMAGDSPTAASDEDPRWRLTPTKYLVAAILTAAIIVPLLVFSYDQIEPRLFGFPFFYWYQLAWVFLAAGCCAVSYALLQRERRAYERAHPRPAAGQERAR
jgi:hypothetical protein